MDKQKERSCPESSPVLRFDLLEFLVDASLYPLALGIPLREFVTQAVEEKLSLGRRQDKPWLVRRDPSAKDYIGSTQRTWRWRGG